MLFDNWNRSKDTSKDIFEDEENLAEAFVFDLSITFYFLIISFFFWFFNDFNWRFKRWSFERVSRIFFLTRRRSLWIFLKASEKSVKSHFLSDFIHFRHFSDFSSTRQILCDKIQVLHERMTKAMKSMFFSNSFFRCVEIRLLTLRESIIRKSFRDENQREEKYCYEFIERDELYTICRRIKNARLETTK